MKKYTAESLKKELYEGINIDLRSEVLAMSLSVEDAIHDLYISHLNLNPEKKSKFFNSKKNLLPFQSKLDILYDSEIIEEEEKPYFELVMNFRNRFLHDIECTSFEQVIKDLNDKVKSKRLTEFKYIVTPIDSTTEQKYQFGYRNLYMHCMYLIQDIQDRQAKIYIDNFIENKKALQRMLMSRAAQDKLIRAFFLFFEDLDMAIKDHDTGKDARLKMEELYTPILEYAQSDKYKNAVVSYEVMKEDIMNLTLKMSTKEELRNKKKEKASQK